MVCSQHTGINNCKYIYVNIILVNTGSNVKANKKKVHVFLIGKDATTKKENFNCVIFHQRQCRPSCERLQNNLNISPIPGEIGTVVKAATSIGIIRLPVFTPVCAVSLTCNLYLQLVDYHSRIVSQFCMDLMIVYGSVTKQLMNICKPAYFACSRACTKTFVSIEIVYTVICIG